MLCTEIFCAIVLFFTATSLAPTQTPDSDQEHERWIESVLESIQTIQPGMAREELSKVFTTEGGLPTRFQRTYVCKDCPHIKVKVEFERILTTAQPKCLKIGS